MLQETLKDFISLQMHKMGLTVAAGVPVLDVYFAGERTAREQ